MLQMAYRIGPEYQCRQTEFDMRIRDLLFVLETMRQMSPWQWKPHHMLSWCTLWGMESLTFQRTLWNGWHQLGWVAAHSSQQRLVLRKDGWISWFDRHTANTKIIWLCNTSFWMIPINAMIWLLIPCCRVFLENSDEKFAAFKETKQCNTFHKILLLIIFLSILPCMFRSPKCYLPFRLFKAKFIMAYQYLNLWTKNV